MSNTQKITLNLGDKFSFTINRDNLSVDITVEVVSLGRDCFFMVSGQGVCKDEQPRNMPVNAFVMYLELMGAKKVFNNEIGVLIDE